MKNLIKKTLLTTAILLSCTVANADYPDKPIEITIPFGAGGNTDTSGRIFINALRKALGADVVAINVAGAGGTIGLSQLAKKNPDGYSLGFAPSGAISVQPQLRKLPYGEESFIPVALIADNPAAISVAPDSPYNNMDDLIAASKSGKVVAVGGAPASIPYMAQAAVAKAYDTKFVYLPAGGGAKAAKAILGGEATFSGDASSMITNQGLKGLAILAENRLPNLPDVPTLKEQGHDLRISVWFALLAPKGTPDEIIKKLSEASSKAVKDPDFVDAMEKSGYVLRFMPHEQFKTFYSDQFNQSKTLLELIGAKK